MAALHSIADEVLAVQGFFEIVINAVKVGIKDFGDVF